MAGLASIVDAITTAQERAAELDALVVEEQAKEAEAVAKIVREHPGENPYEFGTAAAKHRQTWKKAIEDGERLQIELAALEAERQRELAAQADKQLQKAIKDLRTHRPALEKLYGEAGTHVAALADLWLKVKSEVEAFSGKVTAGRDLVNAAVSNPDAQAQWNDAVWSLSDLGPLPGNVAYFVEGILAAAIDPEHHDEFRINTMRCDVGIPDIRDRNLLAYFSGDVASKRGGSDFADSIQAVAFRNEPKPEPQPQSPEQIANEEARAAEVERRWQAQQAREQQRRVYANGRPSVATLVGDSDPSGMGLSERELAELARL